MWACTSSKHCTSVSNYIKQVDTTKPYKTEGKYCISGTRDTTLENDMSIVRLNVFDRRNGKYIHDAVAWFYNEIDTTQLLLNDGYGYEKLISGRYVIGVSSVDALGFSTKKKIDVKKNKQTEINIYLGSSLQW